MTNESNSSTAAQDLAYIRRIMEEARYDFAERGEPFIVWSVVVLIGLAGTWLLPHYYPGWTLGILWAGLIVIGWLVTWFSLLHHQSTSSPAGKLCGAAWLACTIAMVIILFAGIPAGIISSLSAIMGIVSAIVGIGTFMNGILIDLRWFRNLAFGWWAGAVAVFLLPGAIGLLIFAIMIVAFYLIPGLILNAQIRKQDSAARA